jgi:hypothetical protein|tara:strand:+ start:84 stop:329 length:246 start_codon:yes stop_codon:yes gene_type:complete
MVSPEVTVNRFRKGDLDMKMGLRKFTGIFLILLIPIGFVQCVQYEKNTTLYSDGSGKISMNIAVKRSTIDQMAIAMEQPYG